MVWPTYVIFTTIGLAFLFILIVFTKIKARYQALAFIFFLIYSFVSISNSNQSFLELENTFHDKTGDLVRSVYLDNGMVRPIDGIGNGKYEVVALNGDTFNVFTNKDGGVVSILKISRKGD